MYFIPSSFHFHSLLHPAASNKGTTKTSAWNGGTGHQVSNCEVNTLLCIMFIGKRNIKHASLPKSQLM